MTIEVPNDDVLRELAASSFGGECPVPQEGESPYTISFYRMVFVLLARIRVVEKLEAEIVNLQSALANAGLVALQ